MIIKSLLTLDNCIVRYPGMALIPFILDNAHCGLSKTSAKTRNHRPSSIQAALSEVIYIQVIVLVRAVETKKCRLAKPLINQDRRKQGLKLSWGWIYTRLDGLCNRASSPVPFASSTWRRSIPTTAHRTVHRLHSQDQVSQLSPWKLLTIF